MRQFSSVNRSKYLDKMVKQQLDLLVIGGGITGAGIALDAQIRGLTTGLIEMQDFAAGTSSRSTKLVHGGLRYLKQFEVKLVAEVGKERAIVYENAPHVTTPVWMLLPIVKNGTFGKFSTSIGLMVYDFLAGVKKDERRTMLNQGQTLRRVPILRQQGLKGSGVYVEYRTDDARLTIEVIKEAVNRGVLATNYTKAEGFIYEDGKVVGVNIKDLTTGEQRQIYAKKIVNAAGPWVDTLREKDKSKKDKYLHLTKGVHLVFDSSRFPLTEAVYFDTPFKDGRMMFAIPRDNKTYVGTTDTNYKGSIRHPRMTVEDRDYILAAANYMFPNLNLCSDDIESSWVGLRPLIHEEGKDPSEISRKDEIFVSPSGLITIAGGKLTGYRKMAEGVVNLVLEELSGDNYPKCITDRVILSGGHVGGSEQYPFFLQEHVLAGTKLGLTTEEATRLVKRYGSNISHIYDIIKNAGGEAEEAGLSLEVYSSLVYGIEQEMVETLCDFFIRRTSSLFFDMNWVQKWKEPVAKYMSNKLNWSEEKETFYRDELEKHILDATIPEDSITNTMIQTS